MASTIIDPTAVLIANEIDGLTTAQSVKAYAQDPGLAGLDTLPAGVVGLPSFERVGVDDREPQIGSTGWWLTFPVEFYFDIADPEFTATQAVETVEAFVLAIDANPGLGQSQEEVIDTKVVSGEPVEILEAARPMLAYATRVQVLRLVPNP